MRLREEEGARDIPKGVDKRGSEVLCASEQPVSGCLCAPMPSRAHVAVFPAPECVSRAGMFRCGSGFVWLFWAGWEVSELGLFRVCVGFLFLFGSLGGMWNPKP